jgi:lipopolysaccharide transport system permease protein
MSTTEVAAPASPAVAPEFVIVIEPHEAWWHIRWRELWRNRELLLFLVWRDIKVRYKQTALGIVWALLQPISAVIIFSVFFGRLAKIPTGGMPYPLFAYTGTIIWQFFSRALGEASTSVAANERLLSKVYFPRLYLPLSAVLSAMVDLFIPMLLALPMMLYFGFAPGWTSVLIPLVLLMVVMTAFGAGMMFSALDARYRDVRYVLPFLMQVWMFSSPVVYPSTLVPARLRDLYALNPLVGFIETFRVALLGGKSVSWHLFLSSALASVVILVIGLFIFQRVERRLTDVV